MMWLIFKALRDEKGQGMVEYGLIIALVAVATIAATTLIGHNAATTLTTAANSL